jgi:hypothetical protein
MRLRITAPDGRVSELAVDATVVRLGRNSDCEVPFEWQACPMVSGEPARLERTASGWVFVHRSGNNKSLLSDKPVDAPVAVKTARWHAGHER